MSDDRIAKLEDMLIATNQQTTNLIIEIKSLVSRVDTRDEDITELKDEVRGINAQLQLLQIEHARVTTELLTIQKSSENQRKLFLGGIVTFVTTVAAGLYLAGSA